MHFLLVNNNPAVSRLITLSVEKLGFKIDEVVSFDEAVEESYDVVFVDSEQYSEITIDESIEEGLSRNFVYLSKRGEDKPENMSAVLEKPFLPTDFIDLVAKIDNDSSDDDLDIDNVEEESLEERAEETKEEIKEDKTDSIVDEEEIINSIDIEDSLELEEIDEEELEIDEIDEEEISDIDMSAIEEEIAKVDDKDLSLDEDEIGLDEEMLEENDKENEQELGNEEELTSVLDSDDIDEVKQLLEEENDEDDFKLEEMIEEDKDVGFESEDFSLDEVEDAEKQEVKDESFVMKDEIDEDIIEPLEEDLSDASVEELETTLDKLVNQSSEISSIDELEEESLLNALGLSVDENQTKPDENNQDIKVQEEIEEKVSQSVKKALSESSLRDALKGMKVNISISFEEDN